VAGSAAKLRLTLLVRPVTLQQVIHYKLQYMHSHLTRYLGATRSFGACSNCRARKVCCDHDGVNACRQCTKSGRADECVAQERRPSSRGNSLSAPAPDLQVEVSQRKTRGRPKSQIAQPVTSHLPNTSQAKQRHQSKSKSHEQDADTQDTVQTGVLQACNVPSMDPIFELEDEIDDLDVLPDRLKGVAGFLSALSGGNDDDEADECGSSGNEDFDMDVSLSDTDGDEESEDDDIELVQFLQQKYHAKPTVNQQKQRPGRPKAKPIPAAEPVSFHDPQTCRRFISQCHYTVLITSSVQHSPFNVLFANLMDQIRHSRYHQPFHLTSFAILSPRN